MVIARQYTLNPPPPPPKPPAPTQRLLINGRLRYPKGPWGSDRPVRHRGSVVVRAGILWNPHGDYKHHKRPTGPYKMVTLDGGNNYHIDQAPLYGGDLISPERFTEADGTFSITTDAVEHGLPIVLEMRDYNFVSAGEDARSCFADLRWNLWSGTSTFLSSYGSGVRTMPWWPPRFMTQVAVVNGVPYHETQRLARCLANLVKSPNYPVTIKVARESRLSQGNITGEDYCWGQEQFRELAKPNVQSGFPQRLYAELAKVATLNVNQSDIAAAMAGALDRLAVVDVQQMETGVVLDPVLKAIGDAVQSQYIGPPDTPEDMATSCAMLALAALMERDGAKPSITLQAQDLANNQKMLNLEVKLTK